MTEEKKYIITEEQLQYLADNFIYDTHETCEKIVFSVLSHPHSERKNCPHWRCTDNLKSDFRDQNLPRFYCDNEQSIRQDEREKVLDELIKAIDDMEGSVPFAPIEFNDGRELAYNYIKRKIAELRQQQGG